MQLQFFESLKMLKDELKEAIALLFAVNAM
jgi:hypothetical protein